MKKTLTIAQIGCGYWGPNPLRVFTELEGASVKWLCDLQPGRLDWAKQRYPNLKTTTDYNEILNDQEVQAIVIATQVVTHFRLAKAALEAGKHVFVEKPLAHLTREAEVLAQLSKRKRLTLGVGHVYLYHPAFKTIRAELIPSRLGTIHYMDFVRINPGPPAPKHNVIWDMAPHDVAMAIFLAKKSPKAVRATSRRYVHGDIDEAAFLELSFPNNIMARIHVSWLSSRRVRRVDIYAENGSIFYDDMALEKVRIVTPGKDTRVGAGPRSKRTLYYGMPNTQIPAISPEEPLKLECKDFLESVRKQRQSKISGPDIGVQVVRVLETACKSASAMSKAEGHWIRLK